MKRIKNHALKFIFLAFVALAATGARAQDARLRFEQLDRLENRAVDVVEVNVEGKMLDLAKRVLVKVNDPDSRKIGQAISGLRGIYVRVFNFENPGEYDPADVEQIRAQLRAPGWERLANVRSKKNNQKIDVFTMFTGDQMSGVAVVISEAKSIALVNVVGPIDIDLLAEMSGKMNIPKIEIEKETPKN